MWYQPTNSCIKELGKPWIASYSGGKDSTSLVSWIEWLRRTKQIEVEQPRLVLSDTGVEYPFLEEVSASMMNALTASGWQCDVVRPKISEKLYNQIFGRGLTPVRPAIRNMRWCTRATKIDPMKRHRNAIGSNIMHLTGSRWDESEARNGRLRGAGCSAGGECGTSFGTSQQTGLIYSPIVNWTNQQVFDWLCGSVIKSISSVLSDLFTITKQLTEVYGIKKGQGFNSDLSQITSARFGCMGCPAINKDTHTTDKYGPINQIYGIWRQLYKRINRLGKINSKGSWTLGPLRMETRKTYFEKLLRIQEEHGIVLVNTDDIAYIHECWDKQIYPRGWTVNDENNVYTPTKTGLLSLLVIEENQKGIL